VTGPHCSRSVRETNVYVDGFNLYYRCLKETPYKWLDLAKFCELLLPRHDIKRIRYFTAIVESRRDPRRQQRQQSYIRALRTIPNLSVHYGHFRTDVIRLPLAQPPPGGARIVEVLKTEEKGSDVNLATLMLVDACREDCQVAVVVSNDSDLKAPIAAVRTELGCRVGVLVPGKTPWSALPADFYRPIRQRLLAVSQFPLSLHDARGTIRKPPGW
jgi:uncharacterized LabA/DUF88 family protein